jgi:hypothetical protein
VHVDAVVDGVVVGSARAVRARSMQLWQSCMWRQTQPGALRAEVCVRFPRVSAVTRCSEGGVQGSLYRGARACAEEPACSWHGLVTRTTRISDT